MGNKVYWEARNLIFERHYTWLTFKRVQKYTLVSLGYYSDSNETFWCDSCLGNEAELEQAKGKLLEYYSQLYLGEQDG